MKTFIIIPAAIATIGFGGNAINPNDLSAEEQTQVEYEADQEFYSTHFVQLPDDDPRAEVPKNLISKLNDTNEDDV